MHPILHEYQVKLISKVFKQKQLKIKPCMLRKQVTLLIMIKYLFISNLSQIGWEPLYDQVGQGNYVYDRFTKNKTAYLQNKWLDVGKYANALSLYKENMKELQEHFQFKVGRLRHTFLTNVLLQDIYLRSARTGLKRVLASLRTKDRVFYVGVQCRYGTLWRWQLVVPWTL